MLNVVNSETDEVTSCGSSLSDILAQEVLARGFCLRVKGRGGSMYPFVQTGDMLLIEPKEAAELNIGDVILYRRPSGTYVVHRLIKRNGSATLLTKGDSLRYYDAPVPAEQVLGRVTQIEVNGRRIRLQGWPKHMISWLLAYLGRGCGSNQTGLRRNLGRLWWLIEGRRIR